MGDDKEADSPELAALRAEVEKLRKWRAEVATYLSNQPLDVLRLPLPGNVQGRIEVKMYGREQVELRDIRMLKQFVDLMVAIREECEAG